MVQAWAFSSIIQHDQKLAEHFSATYYSKEKIPLNLYRFLDKKKKVQPSPFHPEISFYSFAISKC